MADLKSFAQPTNTTLYTDVVDTERGFHAAHATMVHNGYASPPVGTINLNNAGGTTRTFSQWTGAAYTNVLLNNDGGYAAPTYSLVGLAQCLIAANIGNGNPGFNFDGGDFMDYDRAANRWRIVTGGAERFIVDGSGTYTKQKNLIQFNTTAPDYNTGHLELRTDDGSDASMGFHRQGFTACQLRHSGNGLILSGTSRTDPANLLVLGKILQAGVTDDGVTALQTTSYSASNQPSLINGKSTAALSIAASALAKMTIDTKVVKGGVFVAAGNTKITVPVVGSYFLSGCVYYTAPSAGASSVYIRILKNTLVYRFQAIQPVSASSDYILNINIQIPLLQNDYIEIEVGNNTTGSSASTAYLEDISLTKIN